MMMMTMMMMMMVKKEDNDSKKKTITYRLNFMLIKSNDLCQSNYQSLLIT